MAWPPPTLTTARSNATPQNNTHAADHNAISLAVNDTRDFVLAGHYVFYKYGAISNVGRLIVLDSLSTTTNAFGEVDINYTVGFSSIPGVIVTNGDMAANKATVGLVGLPNTAGFRVRAYDVTAGAAYQGALRVNYIAIGNQ